jgi:hypothetical protein
MRSSVATVQAVCSLVCAGMILFGSCGFAAATGESNGLPAFELVGLDERAGRAVLLNESAQIIVLELDEESADGLLLRAVADGSALLDVRHASTGEVIAYRIRLGETLRVRPLREQGGQDVQVIATTPESGLASRESAPDRD